MKIFTVFETYPDGDSNTVFHLLTVGNSVESCLKYIKNINHKINRLDPCHISITKETPYFIGKREDCEQFNLMCFGGYVIEEMEVLE